MKRVIMTVDFTVEVPDDVKINDLYLDINTDFVNVWVGEKDNDLIREANVLTYETKSCEETESPNYEVP